MANNSNYSSIPNDDPERSFGKHNQGSKNVSLCQEIQKFRYKLNCYLFRKRSFILL